MADASHSGNSAPSRIQRLPHALIERIAAGEVIERPASVVRELLDNALDAGAHALRVEIRDGGLRLIRVADDGCGIPREDLSLACLPHTSSKVATLADLADIRTLGFRGEALASIAAVAELEIASASDDSGLADVLRIRPDGSEARSTAARARGVTVAVRNLFGSVPARRALLRGPRGEGARVLAVVRTYALAHPDIRFTLVSDGLLVLQTPGAGLPSTVTAIYGADTGSALLPLGMSWVDQASFSGTIAARGFTFPGRDHVIVAVNGRYVSNRALLAAAESGYRPLLRKGRHPLLVVHLVVPPDRVDPNIHPAKAEVLLRDEPAITVALRSAVHTALGAVPLSAGPDPSPAMRPRPIQLRLPAARRRHRSGIAERASSRYSLPASHDSATSEDTAGLTAITQFDDTLIVARSVSGSLYLVDQHRAHERALYEQLKLRAAAQRGSSQLREESAGTVGAHQLLLDPVLVELTPLQSARLAYRTDDLARLGLECQPFGGSVFLVRSLPEVPGAAQAPTGFAAELAMAAAEDTDDWLDHLCIALACRSAIRRGQPLSLADQQRLLDGLRTITARAVCPHGSPLVLRLTASYLSRTFEW